MPSPARTDVGNAIRSTLISPNESDSNLEAANVVDGLFAIARAIDNLALATRRVAHGDLEPTGLEAVGMALNGGRADDWPSVKSAIAEGFGELATAIRETREIP